MSEVRAAATRGHEVIAQGADCQCPAMNLMPERMLLV
jgi:hypothetical protein